MPLWGRIRLRRIKGRRNSCACRALSNAKTRRARHNVLENENAGERRKGKLCWEHYNKKSAPAVDASGRNVMTRVVAFDTYEDCMRRFHIQIEVLKTQLKVQF